MRHLDMDKLAKTVVSRRKELKLSQGMVAERTGINRSLLSRLEKGVYVPSIDQYLALADVLEFEHSSMFADDTVKPVAVGRKKIAVAGTGYVGLSLAEHEERKLSLKATTDGESAYSDADFIIVAAPTNYDPKTNFFDCSAVEAVLALIQEATADRTQKPTVVIKSTIPVGYTVQVRAKMNMDNIIFSPEFLRESKALYDNLYPSRIIVGSDEENMGAAEEFASLLQQGAIKTDIPVLFIPQQFGNYYLSMMKRINRK